MRWLELDDLLRWCREIDSEDTRATLTAIGNAVEQAIENHLARPVLTDPPENGSTGIQVNDVIIQAARMLVSHFNEHRESTTEYNLDSLPFGYDYLLRDYRLRSNP